MQIILKSLKLKNFKGIKDFKITFEKTTNIFGDNSTGKTTLADAFMWLLFDKDSLNRKDFEIKTLRLDGEPEHGLEHSVEAELELPNNTNNTLTLKKIYTEKWSKKKGAATATFTGHTTDYYIDGVPVKKKEYEAKIAEIADEQIFRLLTDPRYFNEVMHWQKRRELLLEVCGDVKDEDVIANNTKLETLSNILGNRSIEQHRKIIQTQKADINREIEKIPVRIDEVKLNLPNIEDIANEQELAIKIVKLRDQLKIKQEELTQVRAGGKIAEKTKELRMIEAKLMDLRNKYRQELDKKAGDKSKELSNVQSAIYKLKTDIDTKKNTIKFNETQIKSLDEKIEKLRNDWHKENSKVLELSQSNNCPSCGQPLPDEHIEETNQKALTEFNRNKAEKLEEINAEGKRLKEMKKSMEANLAIVRQDLSETEEKLIILEEKELALKTEVERIIKEAQPVESTEEYIHLQKQYEDIQKQIQKAQSDTSEIATEIQKEIDNIINTLKTLEQSVARIENYRNGLKRIEELKEQERKFAKEYEKLEHQLYLTEEFIRTKVKLLENQINSKFKLARFKLFDVQVNGAVAECCETTFNGVPYSNLNNGAKLNIGLDIINTLAEHYKFAPPVWLDNAESVTNILPTKGQQIRLIVSAQDKKLRVEVN